MVHKTVNARRAKSSRAVVDAVRRARAEAGVEKVLVVYEDHAAHIYMEKELAPRKAGLRNM